MKTLYLGDLHGDFKIFARELSDKSDLTIIQVGDFGVFNETDIKELKKVNSFFKKRNIHLLAIRGNHDCPYFFDGSVKFSNIELLKDYTTRKIGKYNYLFVGGAISIDRRWRIKHNKGYWLEEVFVLDADKATQFRDIDVIVSHNSPIFCSPKEFNTIVYQFAASDVNLLEELIHERTEIEKFYDIVAENNNVKLFINGHFHFPIRETFGDTKFIALSIAEFLEEDFILKPV